jgi:3-methyladenine DNA glycosylase AlkD
MNQQFRLDLDQALLSAAAPERACAMRAYMRDQFDFLGVPTPQRRLVLKPLLKQLKGSGPRLLLDYARQLWQRCEREYQYVALDMLAMHWKEFSTDDLPELLALAQDKSWWDSVDGLAAVIGDILRYTHEGMDLAVQHNNMWVRRIAILHQLGWREKTDTKRLFFYALKLAHEKEFFIQKAIGWALRDYARHDPEAVRRFTQEQKLHLSALSYREANKHLK